MGKKADFSFFQVIFTQVFFFFKESAPSKPGFYIENTLLRWIALVCLVKSSMLNRLGLSSPAFFSFSRENEAAKVTSQAYASRFLRWAAKSLEIDFKQTRSPASRLYWSGAVFNSNWGETEEMVSNCVFSHPWILNDVRFKHSKRSNCIYFLFFFFKDLTHGLWTGHLCPHRLVLFKLFLSIG